MAYTIKLIRLECFEAQEIGGDEIYIKLNGEKVWEAAPDKMSAQSNHEGWVSQYDFAGGRKQTRLGWLPLTPYNAELFVFRNEEGGATLQLWDADRLTRDDLIGEATIDESQATGGNISVVMQGSGAHYRLTYRVERQG